MTYSLPKTLIHMEGAAMCGVSAFWYFYLDGTPWMFLLFFLLPDISMLGYATKNTQLGSMIYNAGHTYILPAALLLYAFVYDSQTSLLIALIWIAHIGLDRAIGYGLKYPSSFKDTHLQHL